MEAKNKKILVIGIIIILILCGFIFAGIKYYNSMSVVSINGQTITRDEFKNRFHMETAKVQYGSNKKPDEKQISSSKKVLIDSMIDEKLLIEYAKKQNLYPKDETGINKEVDNLFQQYLSKKENKDKFEGILKQYGLTLEDYKNNIKNTIINTKIRDEITKKAVVSDDDAKNYYEQNKNFYTEKPNKVNISVIVLKNEKNAQDLYNKLKANQSFEELAKEFSIDPSKDKGGLLGDLELNSESVNKDLLKVSYSLKEGQFSGVEYINASYYIIKLNSKTNYDVKPFDSVKEQIKKDANLISIARATEYQKVYNAIKKSAKITTNQKIIDSIK